MASQVSPGDCSGCLADCILFVSARFRWLLVSALKLIELCRIGNQEALQRSLAWCPMAELFTRMADVGHLARCAGEVSGGLFPHIGRQIWPRWHAARGLAVL